MIKEWRRSVLWARHGENVANLTKTLSYRIFDGDLTDIGRRQARDLAERLAVGGGDPIGLLACSPLRRARQTADIVGRRLGLPVAMELDDPARGKRRRDGRPQRRPGVGDLRRGTRRPPRAVPRRAARWSWRTARTCAWPCPAWQASPIPARTCQPAQWPRSTSTPAVPRWRGW
jgi:broad specificity phosphatase PhoE